MTSEEKKALIQRLFKALDDNEIEILNEILSPDLVVHNPDPQNRDDNSRGVAWWHKVFTATTLKSSFKFAKAMSLPPVSTRGSNQR
jgi:hypothetical protein